MSRAAILPLPGDPFLFAYWLRQFDRIWGDEVDKLYVYLNTYAEIEVVNYIRDLCNERPKINFQYNPEQIPHGVAIDRTLDVVTEDHIMLIEDDAFIFKKGVVSKYFNAIESGICDVVASVRGSCSAEIVDRAQELWRTSTDGLGDTGPNFWPNFFFCKKQTLLDTDRNFDSKQWKAGEYIESLAFVAPVDVVGDTFVNTSLQLRAKNLKFWIVPQWHLNPSDVEDFHANRGIFGQPIEWFHIGSLSSGVGGVLVDDNGRRLGRRPVDAPLSPVILPTLCNSDGERLEWHRRLTWWLTAWEKADPRKLLEFHDIYGRAIRRVIVEYKLSEKQLRIRQVIYSRLTGGVYD